MRAEAPLKTRRSKPRTGTGKRKRRKMHCCPLCQRYFSALNKHMKNMHLIRNSVERRLLLNMASGRVNIRAAPCPVPGCQYQLSRLDRHIHQSHTELSIAERAAKMNQARRIRTMELLAELRATDPTPAMESTLDLYPGVPEEDIDVTPPSPVAECGSSECRCIRHEYEWELERVKAERDEFCREVRLLRRKLQKQQLERVTEGGRSSAASEEVGPSSAASEEAGPSSAASEEAGPSSFRQRQGEPHEADKPPAVDGGIPADVQGEGLDPTPKMSENAISKVSRVKTFIMYMANNRSRLSDWLFLDNMSRIRGLARSVVEGGMKITTAKFYLQNTLHFIKFMTGIPPKTCRLTRVQFTSVERELKMGVRSLQRRVVVHQMSTKRLKISKLPSRQALRGCLSAAAAAIPQLLGKLEAEFDNTSRFLCYGYQCAYWSCLFGHRPGVYANMTDNEVEEAKTLGQDRGCLLHIKEHKTNRTFGEAQMFLNPAEFAWLERWMAIKRSLPDANKFVLYTKGKGPSKNLNANLQSAWKDMGLAGVINFTLIRTAVATYAKKSQDPKSRKKVADFMCHDTRMADKFYVANPDHCEAEEVRALVSESLLVGGGGDDEMLQQQQQQQEEEEMEVGGGGGGEGGSGSSSSGEEDEAAPSSSSANPPPQEVEEEGTPIQSIPEKKTTKEQSKQRMRVRRLRFPPKKFN
ncbi:uncharacterized protein LOC118299259 [Scophthalmus maximus]|uniref:uncharacterized protein LOC118299259 n=1 Tax=Scophthalmus maximus TaxID=52904 RepID=UPI001FA909CE|nr:uncharacterized protein LOC118299259 [Scophthalmus maximus]